MARRSTTHHLKIFSDDGSTTKDFAVSNRRLRALKIGGAALILWLLVGSYGCVEAILSNREASGLRNRNTYLELQASRFAELRDELAHIWIINERLRIMLGERQPTRTDNPQTRRRLPSGAPLANWGGEIDALTSNTDAGGIKFDAVPGDLVLATAAGVVKGIHWSTELGVLIHIDHGMGIDSRFGMSISPLIDEGAWVVVGQPVAIVTQSGRGKTQVFYEVQVDGEPVSVPPLIVP